ncbi:MAG: ABC transporter [Gammaproteobacteria bacterium CG_4_10_14_0_8_um_filter_38_16]|nr:MAG: ABC transporter [Gammaproteobacteria bacterium CG_4_10_14_0_8_um_filter_38_16]PJA03469.1 MAG: ABC transporter [Gammaproteobacteria bacterium CG_4_10_14_0_2_um_filter_38_22]PJB10624.1 MAG: ABC transporter [Gammaproteobacteria bacterium CG_4_9_14_3_um_filter_38_9]
MLALQIQDLRKTYSNGVEALKGINLSLEEGHFIGLLGPNGAGKSTTISIINSLTLKTSGSARIFNYDIDTSPSLAKAQIGVVPQEFNFSIFEKVIHIVMNQAGYYGIPRSVAKQRAEKYLKLLELWEKRNHIARNLSGGMKRRLMIARALMHEPKLLILDEPTAGVDVEIRRSMWHLLRQLNAEGKTIILTTHYLEEAETLCDRIAIINHGKIIQDTTKKQLLSLLNVETFIFDLAEPLHTELPTAEHFSVKKIDSMTIEVICEKKQNINTIFHYFNTHGLIISSMRNSVNRLEELFLKLTQKV